MVVFVTLESRMKTVVLLMFLALGCLAHRPQPCRSPPLLTGKLSMFGQSSGKVQWAYATYSYDALGQRIRLKEIRLNNDTIFQHDLLLLFSEGVMYMINDVDGMCRRGRLQADFPPMEIPKNATFGRQSVLGSSSGPGEGLLVNSWTGEVNGRNYITTFTEFGCFPISTLESTDGEPHVWSMSSYFNIVVGIADPQELVPPPYCQDVMLDDGGEPADFYSLFFKQ